MKWNFKSGQPIYQQIMTQLRLAVASGDLPPGGKLPPVRELAQEAGVNPNTMQRALTELERDGLLYTERTSGRYVTDDDRLLSRLKEDQAREYVEELFEKLRQLGMTDAQIIAYVEKYTGK